MRNKFLFCLLLCIFLFVYFVGAASLVIEKDLYKISGVVNRTIEEGNLFEDFIEIENLKESEITISFSFSGGIEEIIENYDVGFSISPQNKSFFYFVLKGKGLGIHEGFLNINGDIIEKIPIQVEVLAGEQGSSFLIDVEPTKHVFVEGDVLQFNLKVNKLKRSPIENVSFSYFLIDEKNNSFLLSSEVENLTNSFQKLKTLDFPEDVALGNVILKVVLKSNSDLIANEANFIFKKPF